MVGIDFEDARRRMVERQIVGRGIHDKRVIQAMLSVPREDFVEKGDRRYAYEDGPLPIGSGQTISQPYIVALMADAALIEPGNRVLEVGAGSGYAAAVLGRLAGRVWTVERHRSLADAAARRLKDLGYDNVHVRVADGSRGLPEAAPFDAILVTAAAPGIPPALQRQLAPGGRLVLPVGAQESEPQRLLRLTRRDDGPFDEEDLGAVRFVPLVGEDGWRESSNPPP